MKEIMHTPVLIAAYVLVSALFAAHTYIEIQQANTKPQPAHWIDIALCALWPVLVVMALVSIFASRQRLKQD